MSKAEAVAAILWAGATLYAIFGGADFGAGFWQMLAYKDVGGIDEQAQNRIERSIGPVWEANHVWLIFALVVFWTGFPAAFADVMETLYIPLSLAALGIVLRGSAFAFGHAIGEGAWARHADRLFAISSILTPFFMGTVVGAIAAGNVPAEGTGDPLTSWIGALPLVTGFLFLLSGAYLAAIFLVDDSRRAGEMDLVKYFSERAVVAAIGAGAMAIVGIFVLRSDARFVFDGLTGPGLPLLIASITFGSLVLLGLLRGWTRGLRPLSILAVVTIIWGWGVAQHPYLLPQDLTIQQGAGAPAALDAMIIVFGAALLIVGPALGLLYWLSQKQVLE